MVLRGSTAGSCAFSLITGLLFLTMAGAMIGSFSMVRGGTGWTSPPLLPNRVRSARWWLASSALASSICLGSSSRNRLTSSSFISVLPTSSS